ncbi:MAG TPA: NAD(P)/FAD-dependent oxidoreductase [Thermoanaerobaculia bacterium]
MPPDVSCDVAIIGAGAAGLAAARALSQSGLRVLVLEARPRTGGRVHSLHVSDLPLPVELGAEFIHGEVATTFRIVDAAALAACELPDDHWWSRGERWQRIDDFWERIDSVRAKIARLKRDVSFAEFLRKQRIPPRLRELACTFVEGYHASHADRISALALRSADHEQDEDSGGNRQFRLAGGQDALLEWLRAGLDPERVELRLGTVVHRVQWSDGDVRVECHSAAARVTERIRARALIVTIPIGVWKAARDQEGAIAFDPPLREKERAVAKLEAGHVVKIAFRFRERFWDDPEYLAARGAAGPLNFLHTNDRFMPTWWTAAPFRSPILTGWAGGTAADTLLAEGNDALTDRALDAMSAAFCVPRKRLDALLVATWTHDWQRDPFSRCAYSYAGVGGSGAHAELARPVRNTLFFAGEATSGDQTGTVAGAVDSGFRAAAEVIKKGKFRK